MEGGGATDVGGGGGPRLGGKGGRQRKPKGRGGHRPRRGGVGSVTAAQTKGGGRAVQDTHSGNGADHGGLEKALEADIAAMQAIHLMMLQHM